MSALLYLLSHKAKNRVKEIFHRPAELVLLLIGVALVVFVIFSGNMDVNPGFVPSAGRTVRDHLCAVRTGIRADGEKRLCQRCLDVFDGGRQPAFHRTEFV